MPVRNREGHKDQAQQNSKQGAEEFAHDEGSR
jgi:hypothetical protein